MKLALASTLMDLQLPSGSVNDWINWIMSFYSAIKSILFIAGRFNCCVFAASLLVSLVQIPVAFRLASMWPLITHSMDVGGDISEPLMIMLEVSIKLGALNWLKNRMKDSFFSRLMERIQLANLDAFLKMDTSYWDQGDPSTHVLWVFADNSNRVKDFLGNLETAINCLNQLGGGFVYAYYLAPNIALSAALLGALTAMFYQWLNRVMAAMIGDVGIAHANLQAGSVESLTNIRTVQSFTSELHEVWRFFSRKAVWWGCKIGIRTIVQVNRLAESSISFGRPLLINYFGFRLVQSGQMQSGSVLILQAMLAEFLVASFDALVLVMKGISIDMYFVQMFLERIQATPTICVDVGTVPEGLVKGMVSFENVNFRYPAREDFEVFQGLSFHIPAGSFTAFVGRSGSGKTTIGRLLLRFYDVQAGSLTFDGHALHELQPRWLRSQMAYVEQEPKLFQGTIRENILYGNPQASPEQVEEVAKAANVSTFAMTLPEGLDADLGQYGQSLSGGQKQRVAIARAMIRNPKLLIMDEATSALDTETERLLQEALEMVMKGRTTVVIAHRLTTVRKADQIIVMQDGQIVETGTHESLSDRPDGVYAELMKHQQHAGNESSEQHDYLQWMLWMQQQAQKSEQEQSEQLEGVQQPQQPSESQEQSEQLEGVQQPQQPSESQEQSEQLDDTQQLQQPLLSEELLKGEQSLETQSAQAHELPHDQSHEPLLESPSIVQTTSEAAPTPAKPKSAAEEFVLWSWESMVPLYAREPTKKEDQPPKNPNVISMLRWMWRMMGNRKWILVASICVAMLEARAKSLVGPRFGAASALLDDPAAYMPAFWLYVSINVQAAIFKFTKESLKDYFEPHLGERLQCMALLKLLTQDAYFYDKNEAGSLTPRVFEQVERSVGCTTMISETILNCTMTLVMHLYQMFTLSSMVMTSTIGVSIPAVIFIYILAMLMGTRQQAVEKADKDLYSLVIESLTNIKTVHAFNGEALEKAKFMKRKTVWWQAEIHKRKLVWFFDASVLLLLANLPFIILFVIVRYHDGRKSGIAVALLYMAKGFFEELGTFAVCVGMLGENLAAMFGLVEMLNLESVVRLDVGLEPKASTLGAIALKDVRFSYESNPDKEALAGISFEVPAGSFTALVGHTGSGKTTVGRLLLRFYNTTAGDILLDGCPISQLNPRWLRQQIGYVEQEPKLFEDSIKHNIRYGRIEANDTEVQEAARAAGVLAFSDSLPQGLDTNVGRFGQNLSGGQKQRVAIARTILKNPKVLILDEATSALDSRTERELQEALDQVMTGRTSIVIAHRLSTVAKANQVVVMGDGLVVQVGSHYQLAKQGGLYAQLMQTFAKPDEQLGAEAGADAGGGAKVDQHAASGAEADGQDGQGLRRRR